MTPPENILTVTRVLQAPRDQVFAIWSDPAHLDIWWGPRGFRTTTKEYQFKEGGVWLFNMLGPDGTDWPNRIRYQTIEAPSRICYRHDSGQDQGGFDSVITFEDLGPQTRLQIKVICQTAQQAAEFRALGAENSGHQTLQRLEEFILSIEGFKITRRFKLPRSRLFELWTQIEHLKNWSGPKGCTVRYPKAELRPGGIVHYAMQTLEMGEMWGMMKYREILPPERLVYEQWFSNEAGEVENHPLAPDWPKAMLTTILFEEVGPQETELTLLWNPLDASLAECAVFEANKPSMSQGWGGSFEVLEEYLKTL